MKLKLADYISGFKSQDRVVLGRALSLVESSLASDQKLAAELISRLASSHQSKVLSLSGPPGVGKSSFIEAFGLYLIEEQKESIAVVAIDPSSHISGGSILGDKTRMNMLSQHEKAFIRPQANGETLGGVARSTRQMVAMLEAFGFDTIIIETVGVGQSEVSAKSMSDLFILLVQPGSGDDLQGVKRGILEVSDLLCVTKADGNLLESAKLTYSQFQSAVSILFNEAPKVILTSSFERLGFQELFDEVKSFFQNDKKIQEIRQNQLKSWFVEALKEELIHSRFSDEKFKKKLNLALEGLEISNFKETFSKMKENL